MSDKNIDKDNYRNNIDKSILVVKDIRNSLKPTSVGYISIENVLKELEIKDKMIDKMAEYLADMDFDKCCEKIPEPCLGCSWEDYEPHTNCIKEHFRNEVLKDE